MRCVRCGSEAVDPVPSPFWPMLPVWTCRTCKAAQPVAVTIAEVDTKPSAPSRLQEVAPLPSPAPVPPQKKRRSIFRRSR